jgi:hypothetical protein
MTTTVTPPPTPLLRRVRPVHLALAVVVVALVVAVTRLAPDPSFIERIALENPTEFDIAVEARGGGGREGAIGLATVRRATTATVEKTPDLGAVWVFRFSAHDVPAGEVRFTRAELERMGWKVRIPDDAAGRLRAQGAVPPP